MYKKKSVLVIGGSGFIGSHLVDELINKKYKVSVLDLKKSKYHNNKAIFIRGSVDNEKIISSLIKKNKIIYHLAGISDLNKAYKNAFGTAKINVLATVRILEYCIKFKVDKFVFASSIYVNSIYGGFYKSSKISCETYIEEFSRLYGLNYRILRYGSIYGARADLSNGIYAILYNGIKSNKLVYKGSINSIRRYIHVKDVASISVKLLANKYNNKYINITGDYDIKVKNLLNMISKITKIKNIKFSKSKYTGHYLKTPFDKKIINAVNVKYNNKIKIEAGIKELLNEINESY